MFSSGLLHFTIQTWVFANQKGLHIGRRSKDQTLTNLTTCIRVWITCYPTSGATWPRSKGNVNTYSIHGANGYDRLNYKFGSFGRVKNLQKQIMSIINDLPIATKPPRSSPKRFVPRQSGADFFHIWLPIYGTSCAFCNIRFWVQSVF